jgi:hypothetical protein
MRGPHLYTPVGALVRSRDMSTNMAARVGPQGKAEAGLASASDSQAVARRCVPRQRTPP